MGAHHGLVGRNLHAAEARGQAAQAVELADVEVVLQAVDIPAGAQAHHDLVQRGVARALAQAVDGALHLAHAVGHAGDGVGHGPCPDHCGSGWR